MVDYFRWRGEDASRNALNAHCYWGFRKQGRTAAEATAALVGKSVADKNEMLFRLGVNFNELPAWQKRGCGVVWEAFDLPATNPVSGTAVVARRRRLLRDLDLPLKDAYSDFVRAMIPRTEPSPA